MKLHYTFLPFLLLFTVATFGQGSSFAWAKKMGNTGADYGYSIVTDNNNDVISTGIFTATVDFDPNAGITNLISSGSYDIYIQKLDSNGNLLWAEKVGGTSADYSSTVVVDDSNNIYITGYFAGTADFDPGVGITNLTSLGGNDIFVLKLTSTGSFVWAKSFGGTGADVANSITVDDSMNVYTTGTFTGTVDFDPGAGTDTLFTGGFFIQKLDSLGNFVWAKQLQGATISVTGGKTVKLDNAGNPVILGHFQSTIDFDPGLATTNLTSNGGNDVFILKLDVNGNFVWAKSFGSINNENEFSLIIDNSGNIISSGNFKGTIDFDPNGGVYNLNNPTTGTWPNNIFIQKLDANGNLIWAKQFGAGADIRAYPTSDIFGNIYTTGMYDATVDFDPGIGVFSIAGGGYIQKLDATGNFVWAKTIGGSKQIYPNAIALDNTGAIYTTGFFTTAMDFNPGSGVFSLTSSGGGDVFVLKLEACGPNIPLAGSVYITSCHKDTIDGVVYSTTGTYIQMLNSSITGCDSVLTIHFTYSPLSGSLYRTDCHKDTINGIVYSTTGTYIQMLNSSITGCDSVLTIHFTYVPHVGTTVNLTSCHAIVYNSVTYSTSGYYLQHPFTANGCDSNLTVHIAINSVPSSVTLVACDNYTLNGQTYTANGYYTQTYTGASFLGCDSTLTIHLYIIHSSSGNLYQTVCDSLAYSDTTYTASGVYTQHIPNSYGCDSALSIHLTVLNSTTNTININACNSYTLNGYVYTASGTYTQWLSNARGCDSTLTINLSINTNTSTSFYQTACNYYTFNGFTYFTSGVHTQHFTSATGCDSAVTLNLIINHPTTYTLPQTACDSFALNGTTYTNSGTYTQHLTNYFGCDSTLTINLTINTVNTTVNQSGGTLTAYIANATYQWFNCDSGMVIINGSIFQGYTPTTNGSYAVMITTMGCTDTSSCTNFFTVNVDESNFNDEVIIYPNPVMDNFSLTLSIGKGMRLVKIFNLLGACVFQSEIHNSTSGRTGPKSEISIDVSTLAKGLYFVEVYSFPEGSRRDEGQVLRKKFVKK